MDISVAEATNLLHKWADEKRIIHCLLMMDNVQLKILGRVDYEQNGTVQVGQTRTTAPLGDRTFIKFPLANATIEYSDAAHMTELVISTLKGHDALLTIRCPSGIIIGLDVLSPLDDLLNL